MKLKSGKIFHFHLFWFGHFQFDLKENLEIQPDTGIFRKSNSMVHFEPFYQHCQWLCIVALENTKIRIHEQENIKTIFDVENLEEFFLNSKLEDWETSSEIIIKKNDYIFIRPHLWHSLEENKLVQILLLNRKIDDAE